MLAHLAFYRAGIAAISEQDPYAGLLVSMHGAGIYRGRYGPQPELKLTFADDVREQVDAFVAEQESAFEAATARARGQRRSSARHDYELLQLYDRMSLLFCINDTLSPPAGELMGYRFEPAGAGAVTHESVPVRGSRAAVLAAASRPAAQGVERRPGLPSRSVRRRARAGLDHASEPARRDEHARRQAGAAGHPLRPRRVTGST